MVIHETRARDLINGFAQRSQSLGLGCREDGNKYNLQAVRKVMKFCTMIE